ncbi:MAG: leucine-rich repeat protein, partial [Clostridia bacterium]|nr:leucine-rich repeat protein [Clostridia bacterium]
MATFKCKMCGGMLDIQQGSTVVECEYCGTKQTLPRLDDERRANLFDRANHLRRGNEFDKAASIYEQILAEDSTDAEVYWSLVLCRYGIEYVEDPSTKKRVPTVNRAQFTSIFDDENYKQALNYSDSYQRIVYEEEARAINEIQKGILAISSQEDPFDIFICYKETDNNGRRTPDSVLAQELYYLLKDEGFKVFFARITLEDKLGSAYEPYIFAALNSAKVMVVLGTKQEHFNAVWVKNEWSRFLALTKQGNKKVLIPAYRDMDPYDLPTEFSHLQAQDMSKLGFMQDLVRGIKKIVGKEKKPQTAPVVQSAPTTASQDIAPLLRRAFMFLEDEDWESADEYAEKVLDKNPECAEAYIVKLCAELRITSPEHLAYQKKRYSSNPIYNKALRFASQEYKDKLAEYEDKVEEYLEQAKREEEAKQKQSTYDQAKGAMAKYQFDNAIKLFRQLGDYRNSAELLTFCEEEQKKEKVYQEANHIFAHPASISSLTKAIELLKTILEYRDSKSLIEAIEKEIKRAEDSRLAREQKQRQEQEARIEAEKKRKQRIKNGVIAGAIALAIIAIIITALVISANIDKEIRGGVVYKPDGDHYVVTGLENEDLTDVVILGEYKGKPVKIGRSAFINNTDITKVEISEGVTEIGEYAFNGCTSLVSVSLPDSLTHIQGWAFMDCSSLEKVELPDGLTYIGYSSFWDCALIKELIVPNSVLEISAAA